MLDNSQLIIECHQFEVSLSYFCYQAHLQCTLCLYASQKVSHTFVFCPAEVTPQVHFPADSGFGSCLGIVAVFVASIIGSLLLSVHASVQLRKEIGKVNSFHGSQFFDTGGSHLDIFVVLQCLVYQILECGIGIDFPPLHIGNR